MNSKIPTLLALLATTFAAGCMPTARAYVGAAFTRAKGDAALQNASGTLNLDATQADLGDTFGADETQTTPYVRGELEWGPQRLRLSGFKHESSGSGTLATAYGDIASGTNVAADFEMWNFTGAWTWDLLPTDMFRLGLGAQVGYSSIDLTVREIGGVAFERVRTDNYVPMPVIDGEVNLGVVAVGGSLGGFEVDLGDADGRYWDGELFVRASASSSVEFIGGYRYLSFDNDGRADSRDFNAEIEVTGWFVGGGIKF